MIAIVGRPNVGKSTLFNRIVGSRRAIVGDEPGITRDRLYGDAEWRGRYLRVIDTGGILPEEKDFIPAEIFRQARVALEEAAAIVMVVDGRSELAAPDLELARLLRRTGKPLFLAVNKVDSEKQSSLIDDFHRLGFREMFAISAEHGRGVDDLLDAVLEAVPEKESTTGREHKGEPDRRIASGRAYGNGARATRNQGGDYRASQCWKVDAAEYFDGVGSSHCFAGSWDYARCGG